MRSTSFPWRGPAGGRRRRAARALAGAALAAPLLAPAAAQQPARGGPPGAPAGERPGVTVHVRDLSGVPLAGAELAVPGSALRAVTDAGGRFRITTRTPGLIAARVSRLGYLPAAVRLPALPGEAAPVVVTLEPLAAPEVTVVLASAARDPLGAEVARVGGLAHRMAIGSGAILTRADLEQRRPGRVSDILRTLPRVQLPAAREAVGTRRTRGPAPRCGAAVWLDGARLVATESDLDTIDPETLEAVEVYAGPASIPSELRSADGGTSCGVIALWTRMGTRRAAAAGARAPLADAPEGRLEELVARQAAYTVAVVDTPARLEPATLRPRYPDDARAAGGEGTVLAELLVDSAGRVVRDAVRIVGATDAAFADAVRAAVGDARFRPAVLGRVPVPQVVLHAFRFRDDRRE